MNQQLALIAILGIATFSFSISASDGPPVSDVDWRTFRQVFHIPLTPDGLLTALYHSCYDVRSFAALKLALGWNPAVPAIFTGLGAEPIAGAQVSLALAAARLRSEEGINALGRMCHNPSAIPSVRLMSIRTMLEVGHEECLDTVLDALRLQQDDQDVVQALSLLPGFKRVPAEKQQELRSLVLLS